MPFAREAVYLAHRSLGAGSRGSCAIQVALRVKSAIVAAAHRLALVLGYDVLDLAPWADFEDAQFHIGYPKVVIQITLQARGDATRISQLGHLPILADTHKLAAIGNHHEKVALGIEDRSFGAGEIFRYSEEFSLHCSIFLSLVYWTVLCYLTR